MRFIRYTIDVNSGEHRAAKTLNKNELALCEVSLAYPAVLDVFTKHKVLGELRSLLFCTPYTSHWR